MEIAFTASGTARTRNCAIRYDDGREVSVNDANPNGVDILVRDTYFAKYLNGEVTVHGTVTVSAEVE